MHVRSGSLLLLHKKLSSSPLRAGAHRNALWDFGRHSKNKTQKKFVGQWCSRPVRFVMDHHFFAVKALGAESRNRFIDKSIELFSGVKGGVPDGPKTDSHQSIGSDSAYFLYLGWNFPKSLSISPFVFLNDFPESIMYLF